MRFISIKEFKNIFSSKDYLDEDLFVRETFLDKMRSKSKEGSDKSNLDRTFNGKNHTIWNIPSTIFDKVTDSGVLKNVTIRKSSVKKSAVCSTNNGIIKNVEVKDCEIRQNTRELVGGLVSLNSGDIINCSFTGDIKATEYRSTYAGGICGLNEGDIIESEIKKSTIEGSSTGGVSGLNKECIEDFTVESVSLDGYTNLGGVCGENRGFIEQGSVMEVTVNSKQKAGGITGVNFSDLKDCVVVDSEVIWDEPNSIKEKRKKGSCFGGLIGESNRGDVNIKRCSFKNGTVEADSKVGGLVGSLKTGDIVKTTVSDSKVIARKTIGGACGVQGYGHLEKVVLDCDLTGDSQLGGVSGYSLGSCESVVFAGDIPKKPMNCAKLFARLQSTEVSNCHYVGDPVDAFLVVVNTNNSEGLYDSSDLELEEVLSILTLDTSKSV